MRTYHWLKPAAVICTIMAIALTGCEHDVEKQDQDGAAVTFDTIVQQVFEPHCATCHMGGAASGGLGISGYGGIVNAPSRQKLGLDLIEPGDTAKSYLYLKITGDSSIEGSRMPPGDTLPQDKITLMASWIDAGAPEAATVQNTIISSEQPVLSRR